MIAKFIYELLLRKLNENDLQIVANKRSITDKLKLGFKLNTNLDYLKKIHDNAIKLKKYQNMNSVLQGVWGVPG